jgi:hypothetical protein
MSSNRLGSSTVQLAAHASQEPEHLPGLSMVTRVLDRLPQRLIVVAVEGRTFEAGTALSDDVAAAAPELACAVLREATELAKD